MTITRHPATPNITVAPGDVTVVGYSITYPAQYTNVHLKLQYSTTSRNLHDAGCSHFDLDYAIVGAASNCTSTDGLTKTDWYVLRINGTEDIDGQMVKCVLLNSTHLDQVFDASCEELTISVTNGNFKGFIYSLTDHGAQCMFDPLIPYSLLIPSPSFSHTGS